jgi:two-component system, NtrC family, sensor kinase
MNFSAESFLPHGQCLLWDSGLLWLHMVSDGLITFSYLCISVALIYLVKKRKDLAFPWIFSLFGSFIFLCGVTHAFGIWILWAPVYWIEGEVKLLTAVVSLATTILLVPLIPKALALPTPAQMDLVNQALRDEIGLHKETAKILEHHSAELIASHAELLRFNRLAVGRELRMVDLKKQVNQLCLEAGKSLVYDLARVEQEGQETTTPA